MEELNATDNCRFLDIGVNVCEALSEGVHHVFCDTVELEGAERSEGKAAYLMVGLLEIHQECVDGQDSQLLVLLGVVDEVEIHHFLGDDIVGSRCFDHLGVEP